MRIFTPKERPGVEVFINGDWHPGELRGTWQRGGLKPQVGTRIARNVGHWFEPSIAHPADLR